MCSFLSDLRLCGLIGVAHQDPGFGISTMTAAP